MKPIQLVLGVLLLAVVGGGTYYLGALAGHRDGQVAANDTSKPTIKYTCGMHPQIIQDEPGNCSICGMKLSAMRRDPGSGAGKTAGERKIKHWRAPMDPAYISDKPGKSPMGMDLVPVYEEAAGDASAIAIDPVTIQNMGIRTAVVTKGPLSRTIRTVGVVELDETALADVTTKFMGWVEKLYVDSTGVQVHRGEPLFEVYSPELYSAQTEYLLALKSAGRGGDASNDLLAVADTKLKYWDISDAQIAELKATGEPQKTLKILAPIDGFVLEKMVVEGQMVSPGKQLYRIADLGLVWMQAQIYEQDLPFIKLGQEAAVTLSYLPDRQFRGRVTYIYPNVDPKTRTAKVRMEFHNPGFFLKPGMFAAVELRSELAPSVLLVPNMAVLRSGYHNTVFVALPDGKFAPREVRLGARAEEDMMQVLAGLQSGERVVTSGQFLLDSESQLREAVQKMVDPNRARASDPIAPNATGDATDHEAHAKASADASAATTYICPMPEHVSIEYDHPGDCPICGMNLVPVSEAVLKKINPGGPVDYYTCPMPEHSDVHLDHPGKCPHCRMTLIPVMQQSKPSQPDGTESATSPDTTPLPALYTCPMGSHAHVVSDQPGKCPDCEMKLVETSTVQHQQQAEDNWRKQTPTDLQP